VSSFRRRVPTARLNDVVRAAIEAQSPPTEHGRVVKIFYATQASASPPHVVLFGSQREKLPQAWIRFLTHRLRDEFALVGVPLKLSARQRQGRRDEPVPGATPTQRSGAKPRSGPAAKPKPRIPVPKKPKLGSTTAPHKKRVAAKQRPSQPRGRKPRR
jgi:hypothetical protein